MRTMTKKRLLAAPVAVSLMLLAGCASSGDNASADGDVGKAALVVAQGGLGDESYNDLGHAGFTAGLKATGMTGSPIESQDIVGQGEQILRRAGQANFSLVIDLEYSHGEVLPSVAADYPKTNWALVNAEAKGDNVASVLFREQEGSYLAGALAAMVTTDSGNPKVNAEKVIGVIGGTKSVGIDKFIVGYIQGAQSIDPDMKVLTAYSNDFADPAGGQQLAQSMFDQGADIVFAVAGGTGAGVIKAAADAGHYAIGVDTDQDGVAEGSVLTSMLKKTDVAVETLMKNFANGEFPGGTTVNLGLAEDGVGLSDFTYTKQDIPAEHLTAIDDIRAKIISGDIKVWDVVSQGYPSFFAN